MTWTQANLKYCYNLLISTPMSWVFHLSFILVIEESIFHNNRALVMKTQLQCIKSKGNKKKETEYYDKNER